MRWRGGPECFEKTKTMARSLSGRIAVGLAVVAVILMAWLYPASMVFPIVVTMTLWGALLGPLIAMLAGLGLLWLRTGSTVWDWVSLAASACLWVGASWWNLHAFAAGYNIRPDLLALIPAMWAALITPIAILVWRSAYR